MSRKRLLLIILLFIAFGLASELLIWRAQKSEIFIVIMAPVLTVAHFLENLIPFLKTFSSLQNELALIFPVTLIYFGLVGFWMAKIFTEEGVFKYFAALCLAGFVVFIHWQALSYLNTILST